MVINLWHNDTINQWRWTLTNPKTLEQYSGDQENIRLAMNDIANTVEYLAKEKNVDMNFESK